MSQVERVEKPEWTKKISPYVCVSNEQLGAKVLSWSDEWFAEAANLIKPNAPIVEVRFVPSGRWYDGWETRRHNPEPSDWVVIELGVPSARVFGCEIDTAFFNGNHAPAISVEGAYVAPGTQFNPDAVKWEEIVAETPCGPSQEHFFVRSGGLTANGYSHVRLHMYPDGGIARFRVWGSPVPVFPESTDAVIDMASIANGGVAIACSDQHFSPANNLLLPGRGNDMSDGWETSRSREPGHFDWVIVKLGAPTVVREVVVDTAFFRGNFPQSIRIDAISAESSEAAEAAPVSAWTEIVPKSKTSADQEHKYSVSSTKPVTHVKLVMLPDGGVKRLRVFGTRSA